MLSGLHLKHVPSRTKPCRLPNGECRWEYMVTTGRQSLAGFESPTRATGAKKPLITLVAIGYFKLSVDGIGPREYIMRGECGRNYILNPEVPGCDSQAALAR